MEFSIVRDPGREGKGTMVPSSNGKLRRVRYRSHATHSRQPRQVRKEATVTSSGVCSGFPVPGFLFPTAKPAPESQPRSRADLAPHLSFFALLTFPCRCTEIVAHDASLPGFC